MNTGETETPQQQEPSTQTPATPHVQFEFDDSQAQGQPSTDTDTSAPPADENIPPNPGANEGAADLVKDFIPGITFQANQSFKNAVAEFGKQVKAETKKNPPPPPPAKKSRETKTVGLKTIADAGVKQSEYDYHNAIFQARVDSGLTKDWNHYIRQCMDFAANYDALKNKFSTLSFARPDVQPLLLKDGYFAAAAPHLVNTKTQ